MGNKNNLPIRIIKHWGRQVHATKKTKRICWLVGWLAGWPAGLLAARFIRCPLLTLPVAHVARCSRCAHRARCTCCARCGPRVEGLGFRV